jgi:dephospho-CoA kinase
VLRIGLTGGIGAGKSAVSQRLAAHGAVIIDADKAARAVVEPGTPGLARLALAFGPGVLREDGSLDRPKLGEIAFGDAGKLATLNGIMHPLIREHINALEAAAIEAGGDDLILVHDVPLLAEGQLADGSQIAEGSRIAGGGFDEVIVVDVPADVQVERLVRYRGMPAGQAAARMAAQATREQRLAIATIVIDNSGTLAELDKRVTEVWADLRARV